MVKRVIGPIHQKGFFGKQTEISIRKIRLLGGNIKDVIHTKRDEKDKQGDGYDMELR